MRSGVFRVVSYGADDTNAGDWQVKIRFIPTYAQQLSVFV